MCGIAGFTGNGSEQDLYNMIQSISHRGPDALVTYRDAEIAFAHARLAIIDLSPEGNQPMFTPDKKLVIVFNGEIYNYLVLKKELSAKYHFHTSSDTEVLLYLYKEYGVEMLTRINGMFAFAIYDVVKKELFLAKDKMGKKPLYYTTTGPNFIFGSELKAVLKHPGVKKQLNIEAVNEYLTYDYVPTPHSINANVNKLEAGHYLIVKNNHILKKASYWNHNFHKNKTIHLEEAISKLDELLNQATKVRLMSDVPLGVFLSGGLDSSTIAYYAQNNSSQKVKSFSIGFEDNSYDETVYAKQIAQYLGTDHSYLILNPRDALNILDKINALVDEPFADASIIPTYLLSNFTRKHVTVALGGDGSDELFAGYPTFVSDKFKHLFSILPAQVSHSLSAIISRILPVSDKNISFDFKVNQFLKGFENINMYIHQLWLGSFTPLEKRQLIKPEVYESLNDKSGLKGIDLYYQQTGDDCSDFDKILYFYYKAYLQDDILVKVDRASMYNSLEVRAPFLDPEVVEFTNTLPKSFKIRNFNGKHILKELMKNKLPKNIVFRSKKGFGIPLSDWIRKDMKSEIFGTLLQADSLFNLTYIEKILTQHTSKNFNHRKLIWNLYCLKKFMFQQGY